MLKLLIFDLDGTLTDTSKDIADAINFALKPFGIKQFTIDEIKAMVGSGITKLIQELIPSEKGKPNTTKYEETIKRFLDYYSAHLLDNTDTYPEVKETLSKFGAYKKAVISNKRETLSKRVLDGLGLLKFFDLVLGSDSVPEKKPSPVPVLEVLKRLGVSKEQAVIIGDSNFDIEAGRAAGIRTIAVTYGYRSKEVLKDADFIIDNFGELLTLLPQL